MEVVHDSVHDLFFVVVIDLGKGRCVERRMVSFVLSIAIALGTLIALSPEAQACDSAVYHDMFSMADSAKRVLVVRVDPTGLVVEEALRGPASKQPVPPVTSNCDPHFVSGARYLLFIGANNSYYPDSSAIRLLGDRGQRWVGTMRQWLAETTDKARSALLKQVLSAELASPPVLASDWRMLLDISRLPMPHPSIARSLEIELAKRLAQQKACAPPEHLGWFAEAGKSHRQIVRVRAQGGQTIEVLEVLRGERPTGQWTMPGIHLGAWKLASGVEYLLLLDGKSSVRQEPIMIEDASSEKLLAFVRSWLNKKRPLSMLRSLARDRAEQIHQVCAYQADRLVLDAVLEVISNKPTMKDCRALDYGNALIAAPELSRQTAQICKRVRKHGIAR